MCYCVSWLVVGWLVGVLGLQVVLCSMGLGWGCVGWYVGVV